MRSQIGVRLGPRLCAPLPFRSVNKRGSPGYDPALQRHHLLPRQLLSIRGLSRMFSAIGRRAIGFEDFRRNGLLLPAKDSAAVKLGLPLHRGPHRDYNEMVIERAGAIERGWSHSHRFDQDIAGLEAMEQLAQLQDQLRENLLMPTRGAIILNRHDPIGQGLDYSKLDDVAEKLWSQTQPGNAASSSSLAS